MTQRSRGGCDALGSSCPKGFNKVSDIHNHPPPGRYLATNGDVRLGLASRVGEIMTITPTASISFSKSDLGVSKGQMLNSWVVPSGSNLIIHHPYGYNYYVNSELTR